MMGVQQNFQNNNYEYNSLMSQDSVRLVTIESGLYDQILECRLFEGKSPSENFTGTSILPGLVTTTIIKNTSRSNDINMMKPLFGRFLTQPP